MKGRIGVSAVLALLAGCALIWLVQAATAAAAAVPGLHVAVAALRAVGLPFELAAPLLVQELPAVFAGALVGVGVFQLAGPRLLLIGATMAPLVAYALVMNFMLFSDTMTLSQLVSSLDLWASLGCTALGLMVAAGFSRRRVGT